MGTSTRKTLPRSNSIINLGILSGVISATGGGNGLSKLIPEFLFPKKGQSKVKKVSNEVFASKSYYKSVKNIVKSIQTINKSGINGLGIANFASYNKNQQIELLCDYINVENDDLLKQSFKSTLLEIDYLEEKVDPIYFIQRYIQNLLKCVTESLTFEDASQNIENFDDKKTDTEYDEFIKEKTSTGISICLNDEFVNNIENDQSTINVLNRAYNHALAALKG